MHIIFIPLSGGNTVELDFGYSSVTSTPYLWENIVSKGQRPEDKDRVVSQHRYEGKSAIEKMRSYLPALKEQTELFEKVHGRPYSPYE